VLQVLTAYARECERAGVRIPRWREYTGCRHVVPFKYSGEHFQSGETGGQTAQANAAHNEVLSLDAEGVEQLDDYEVEEEQELDTTRLGLRRRDPAGSRAHGGTVGAALPAHRPTHILAAAISTSTAQEGLLPEPAAGRRRTLNEEKTGGGGGDPPAVDVRSHRRRQQRMRRLKRQKKKKEKKRKREKIGSTLMQGRGSNRNPPVADEMSGATIGTFNGVLVQRITTSGGGGGHSGEDGGTVRNKLRWGSRSRGDDSPPPFELLLSADDDDPKQRSGEEEEEDDDDEEQEDDEPDDERHSFLDPGGTAGGGGGGTAGLGYNATSAVQLQRTKTELSDKMAGAGRGKAGRTPIPLLDSGEVISQRRFRRRRSESLSSDVANRRNWKRRRQSSPAAASEG
jgi:hypothetical protein